VESEDKVAEAEDDQGHESQNDDGVAPAHVTSDSAAGFSGSDGFAGRQFDVATVFCGSAVRNARGRDNANGLPHGEKRDKEATALWQKFKGNGSIDGDITPKTDRSKEIDAANGAVVELGSGLNLVSTKRTIPILANIPREARRSK
jgi:hypothetical protein